MTAEIIPITPNSDADPVAHEAAEIFPMMSGDDFKALVEDIKEHGLRESIILHEGKILDGRNRLRACREAKVTPTYEQWDGDGTPQAYVVSKNLHRRHLSESQRAIIAAKLANLPRGGDRTKVEISTLPHGTTAKEAADMLNVDRASVFNAKTVLRDGTPEEVDAVEQGNAAVSTTAKNIRERTKADEPDTSSAPEPTREPTPNPRTRIPVPDGMTAEELCRKGMAFEASGAGANRAAKHISVNYGTYSMMRDIVSLADRIDTLSGKDAEAVRGALATLNETQQVTSPHQAVAEIANRFWGNAKRAAPLPEIEAKRLERFEIGFGSAMGSCISVAEIELPYITAERAEEACREIAEAIRNLNALKRRIMEIHQ